MSWQDLLKLWALGKGSDVPFDAGSPLTWQLAGNGKNRQILKEQATKIAAGDDINQLGGKGDYVDGSGWGKGARVPGDLTGMATNGRHGREIPNAFTGGYDEVYQVINKSRNSFTVAFAAFNDTGIASLTHSLPDVRRGIAGASVFQEYYWTMTVNY